MSASIIGHFGPIVIAYLFGQFGTFFFFQNQFSGMPLIPTCSHQSPPILKKIPRPWMLSKCLNSLFVIVFLFHKKLSICLGPKRQGGIENHHIQSIVSPVKPQLK